MRCDALELREVVHMTRWPRIVYVYLLKHSFVLIMIMILTMTLIMIIRD